MISINIIIIAVFLDAILDDVLFLTLSLKNVIDLYKKYYFILYKFLLSKFVALCILPPVCGTHSAHAVKTAL